MLRRRPEGWRYSHCSESLSIFEVSGAALLCATHGVRTRRLRAEVKLLRRFHRRRFSRSPESACTLRGESFPPPAARVRLLEVHHKFERARAGVRQGGAADSAESAFRHPEMYGRHDALRRYGHFAESTASCGSATRRSSRRRHRTATVDGVYLVRQGH
jgi:hypothetical protein